MTKPKCPKCGESAFEAVAIEDSTVSFVCCSACGTIVSSHDTLLLDKLDRIAEALEYNPGN